MAENKEAASPNARDETGGESQGGAYPNPHSGKEEKGGFDGGQSGKAYHGHGQLGEQDVEGDENANAASKED